MSLATPLSVQKLQTALHDKAKESPNLRFYALYDKVYRRDVLEFAYECCKANGGAAGADGQTFGDIEEYGVERWLDELAAMPGRGCASGCAPSTKCPGRRRSSFRTPTYMMCWVWSALPRGRAVFRGRPREPFSGSRMREMRLSGSMSGV